MYFGTSTLCESWEGESGKPFQGLYIFFFFFCGMEEEGMFPFIYIFFN